MLPLGKRHPYLCLPGLRLCSRLDAQSLQETARSQGQAVLEAPRLTPIWPYHLPAYQLPCSSCPDTPRLSLDHPLQPSPMPKPQLLPLPELSSNGISSRKPSPIP